MNNRQVSRVLAPHSDSRQNNDRLNRHIRTISTPHTPGKPFGWAKDRWVPATRSSFGPHILLWSQVRGHQTLLPHQGLARILGHQPGFPYRRLWQEAFCRPSPCALLCRLSLRQHDTHLLRHPLPGVRDAQSSPPTNLRHHDPLLSPEHGHATGASASTTQGAPTQGYWG